MFIPNDAGDRFRQVEHDNTSTLDCTLVADIDGGGGRLDLIVVGGRSNTVAWHENLGAE